MSFQPRADHPVIELIAQALGGKVHEIDWRVDPDGEVCVYTFRTETGRGRVALCADLPGGRSIAPGRELRVRLTRDQLMAQPSEDPLTVIAELLQGQV